MADHLPVRHPSAWHPADLADPSRWTQVLTAPQVGEIDAALRAVRRAGLGYATITRATFPLPSLDTSFESIRRELVQGRGFALLRGVPVERYTIEELQLLFWGIGCHLGTGVTQNARRELIGHVMHKGEAGAFQRGYETNLDFDPHVDLADGVGLLCVQKAKSGGESALVSSTTAYNTMLRERPDLLDVLFEGFVWDRRDEHGPGESPYGPRIPIFSRAQGYLRCRYNRSFNDVARLRSGRPYTAHEKEALDVLDSIIRRRELMLFMGFEPGDIQLVSNYTILHKRTAFEDHPEPARRRHLLRLWWLMDDPGPFSDEAAVRFGTLGYGGLGLTAAEATHA